MKKLILALVMSWPLTSFADFDAGLKAFLERDFATAVQEWQPLAEAGHPDAQNNLGAMYYQGLGVPKDEVRAYAWATLAVAQHAVNASAAKDYLQQHLTPAQLREGENLSRKLCAKIPNCTE